MFCGNMKRKVGGETNRRNVLKGLGMGALALPILSETTAAEQASRSLSVSVEAGEGGVDNWTRRDRITDDFKGRVDVSGLSSGDSTIVVTMFPVGGSNNVSNSQVRTGVHTVDWSNGYVVQSSTWNPSGLFKWQSGTYYLYAVVAEDRQEAFGVAVSDPFEIDP